MDTFANGDTGTNHDTEEKSETYASEHPSAKTAGIF
jgi:hypothetical protein